MLKKLDPQTQQEMKELLGELGPDTLLLFFTNFTVIILALLQGWNIVPLLWIYWWQNVIIGFFNWCRMKQLRKFSVKGLRYNGKYLDASPKTQKKTTTFFLLHYGTFQLFYLVFLLTITKTIPGEVILSSAVAVTLFLFNHFFSYRYNLKKDLASLPSIGNMFFFPYIRIIPMHLIIFIGLWFGRGTRIELFFFLLLKTGADLLMHIIQHINWNETKTEVIINKRMTLKKRLKLWIFLSLTAFLLLFAATLLAIKAIKI